MSDHETNEEAAAVTELPTTDPHRACFVTGRELEALEAAERARRAPKAPVVVPPEARIAAHRTLLDEHSKAQARREELEHELERARVKLEEIEGKANVTAKDLLEEENARRAMKSLE